MNSTKREMITRIITKIQESTEANKEEVFGQQYPNFKEKYPVLFKCACDGRLDLNNLQFMLDVLERMETEGVSQYDASAEVGQMLYSKYVEPALKDKENQ